MRERSDVGAHFPCRMMKLLKPLAGKTYVDLVISMATEAGDEDEEEVGPLVRYHFGN